MSEGITPLAGFEEYATREEARSYRAALQQYRQAYGKVFHLPPPFAPNLNAVRNLPEAAETIAAIEAGHAYRIGKIEGERAAAGK